MESKDLVVGVVGTGQMGRGLVQFLSGAIAVKQVLWKAMRSNIADAIASMRHSIGSEVESGRISAEKAERALSKITAARVYDDLAPCHVVHESVAEQLPLKISVVESLDRVLERGALIATNTSALSITALGAATTAPERLLGMHFFNPVGSMKLVEVVSGSSTSESSLRSAADYAVALGKKPIVIRESPGFVVNRLLIPMINEAVSLLDAKVADRDSIDAAMKFGANHLIGPLALSDLIGSDVVVAILDALFEGTGDPKFRAHPILRGMVAEGRLGKKSGSGFYEYGRAGVTTQ